MTQQRTIIVVGVDYDVDGELAFDAAAQIAATHPGGEVHAIHVERRTRSMPPVERWNDNAGAPATPADAAVERLAELCKERLAVLKAKQPSLWFERVATHVRVGNPAQHIVQLAVDLDADIVVVGSHSRRGVKRLVLGSVSERVVQTASCPVYVVRSKAHADVEHVPEIEPPCPDCLETRKSTAGAEMWCARHALAKLRPRVHRVARGPAGHEPEPWSHTTPDV